MWKGIKLLHRKPRYSQSEGSVERDNRDMGGGHAVNMVMRRQHELGERSEVHPVHDKFSSSHNVKWSYAWCKVKSRNTARTNVKWAEF
jgi:hypothetical protein